MNPVISILSQHGPLSAAEIVAKLPRPHRPFTKKSQDAAVRCALRGLQDAGEVHAVAFTGGEVIYGTQKKEGN